MKLFSFLIFVAALQITSALAMQVPTEQEKKALEFLKMMPSSNYGIRTLCIIGNDIIGTYPDDRSHKLNIRKSTLSGVPISDEILSARSPIVVGSGERDRKIGQERSGKVTFYSVPATVNGKKVDVCVFEQKSLL